MLQEILEALNGLGLSAYYRSDSCIECRSDSSLNRNVIGIVVSQSGTWFQTYAGLGYRVQDGTSVEAIASMCVQIIEGSESSLKTIQDSIVETHGLIQAFEKDIYDEA